MDENAHPSQPSTVDDVDRRLLQAVAAGGSALEAGAAAGATLRETAVRLQALRRRLGVTSTAEAVRVICGTDPGQ